MKLQLKRVFITFVPAIALGITGAVFITVLTPLIVPPAAAEAAIETRTFGIENMTCALCPLTVKKAMEGVNGVRSVEVDFDARTATVTFDPAVTTAGAVAAASTNAGYPAMPKG